jgi:hypothetical protein
VPVRSDAAKFSKLLYCIQLGMTVAENSVIARLKRYIPNKEFYFDKKRDGRNKTIGF